MAGISKKELTPDQTDKLLQSLKARFESNRHRHKAIQWEDIEKKLNSAESVQKLWSLHQMEETGGEPDVVGYDKEKDEFLYFDCAPESPQGRRSLCYDQNALESRKKFKPESSAMERAAEMGIEVVTEDQYRDYQNVGPFDTKTSSWVKTPNEIRELGGAIFGDYRFGRVFIYHNGAESYYKSRGFRGVLRV
ncbi:DUF4256 domain-containing protein [Membranicola marinus]|uniref:DUF4256 domain-containing protein n=1 Tax=Membranihabitans marinus TaxID=1227546 RepID=A0A953HXK5_9BACT|nr:DUF4256 domain-containing protein [Membranihabitans marinus]MBY5958486.1 DUF4256 domain-containing protein [Membranihabitans marinus]